MEVKVKNEKNYRKLTILNMVPKITCKSEVNLLFAHRSKFA